MLVRELDSELSIGECFKHHTFKLDYIIFSQNNPSIILLIVVWYAPSEEPPYRLCAYFHVFAGLRFVIRRISALRYAVCRGE